MCGGMAVSVNSFTDELSNEVYLNLRFSQEQQSFAAVGIDLRPDKRTFRLRLGKSADLPPRRPPTRCDPVWQLLEQF
jgi:hypothetical protein